MTKLMLLTLTLAQLAGPVLKALGWAFTRCSWVKATCLLWGPWAMVLVLAALGWLLRRAFTTSQSLLPTTRPS